MLYYITYYYEDKFGEHYMAGLITFLTTLLVILSLGLVITVPVALATPGQWETSKDLFYKIGLAWGSIVFVIAFASVF